MITDNETNSLFLADTLPGKYPVFYDLFGTALRNANIEFQFLPNTKDVWAVDYMPIQIEHKDFVQFVYNPDYLRDSKRWRKTISDVDAICRDIGIEPAKSNILLDGGNVIKTTDKIIMCDKVFAENPGINEKELIKELQRLFRVDKLHFIPTQPFDFTGHADGMVRFYDSDTVLVNDYSKEHRDFQLRFRAALHNAGLRSIEISYNPYNNKKDSHANGIYINFLQMQEAVVVPTFGIEEDEVAIKKFEQLFPGQTIIAVDGNELAYDGGLFNCITWNIYQ